MLIQGIALQVFSIRETEHGTVWSRAGRAFVNRDGSLNVLLDVLPLAGKLHVRNPPVEKLASAPAIGTTESTTTGTELEANAAPANGHAPETSMERPPMLVAAEGHG